MLRADAARLFRRRVRRRRRYGRPAAAGVRACSELPSPSKCSAGWGLDLVRLDPVVVVERLDRAVTAPTDDRGLEKRRILRHPGGLPGAVRVTDQACFGPQVNWICPLGQTACGLPYPSPVTVRVYWPLVGSTADAVSVIDNFGVFFGGTACATPATSRARIAAATSALAPRAGLIASSPSLELSRCVYSPGNRVDPTGNSPAA